MLHNNSIFKGFVLPGLPHILLAADKNPGWNKVRQAFVDVAQEVEDLNPDVLLIYSTYWPSVVGHQIQAKENISWVHVDDQFHDLGSIHYQFKMDKEFANVYNECAQKRGLHSRTVDYEGFPIDTGSVVALKLINPKNKFKACIVSSNVYSDRSETMVLAKAAVDALKAQNKRAVALVITSLSNRLHAGPVAADQDRISSLKDQEWNEKFLEFLSEGRLEDVAQLSRQFHKEARVHKVTNFKPFWYLSALMGATNLYDGEVLAYEAICGTGAAVVGLTPSDKAAKDLEFDEDNSEFYSGDRNVLGSAGEEIFASSEEGEKVDH